MASLTPTSPGARWELDRRRLYLCTPDRPDLGHFVARCIAGGVDVVQLREKQLADGPLLDRAALVQWVCREHGVPFVLNDRPDLAVVCGADGVHVGQDDTPASEARGTVGPDALVGLSTHRPQELDRAVGDEGTPAPVDYLSAGPVVATPTKPGRPGVGAGYAARASARSPWPVWVTGGVDPDSVEPLAAVGVRHFVVVRWLTEADDPEAAARVLRAVIDRSVERASDREGAPEG